MYTALNPSRIEWNFRDRDAAAARARLEALAAALERRGVPTHLGECGTDRGHVIALAVGQGSDGVVIIAVRMQNGTYEGGGSGNPPPWLLAHLESAWCEIA